MGAAIGDILGMAVGVAISPVPVIAVILMLFSSRASANSLSFLAGWVTGLAAAGLIVLALGVEASTAGEANGGGVIKIVIGALFVVLGIRQWSLRPRGDEGPEMPGWMATIDDFNAAKSFGLAFLLSAVNPKNLGLTIAAVASIGASGLETGEEIGTLAVFVVLASLTVAVPVIVNLVLGSKAEQGLTEMKDWLVTNNNTVMAVLFVVLGAKVLGDGIASVA
ncbi:MAG: GAP family protein, partial [Acidimicrobiia bacterium]|nr:GAP family protein [Acidimicrobiia bacterium]